MGAVRWWRWTVRMAGLACFVLAAAGVGVPAAGAATTVGSTSPAGAFSGGRAIVQRITDPGSPSYTTPAGVITSWSYQSSTGTTAGQVRLVVFRPLGGNDYFVVARSDFGDATATDQTFSFPTRIGVQAGDVLGLRSTGPALVGTAHQGSDQTAGFSVADPAPGETVTASSFSGPDRLDASAVVEPDADADGLGDESQDRNPPILSALKVSPRTFRVDPQGAAAKRHKRAPKGTVFSYVIARAKTATVKYTLERKTRGRRLGGTCKKERRSNRRRPRCTRLVTAATFNQAAAAGQNAKRFSGRVGTARLKPGSYRATLVAKDQSGNASAPQSASFKVVR